MTDSVAEDTNDLDDGTSYSGTDLEALLCLRRYRQWIIDEIVAHIRGHVLEIGVGIGSFSRIFLKFVDRLDMIEPSATLSRTVAEAFKDDGRVTLFRGTFEKWMLEETNSVYDSVVMINVLEHIEDDGAALAGAYRALKLDGRLVLFVPALQFLYSPIDAEFGHFRRYELKSLKQRVSATGFEIVDSHYFDLLGIIPWWLINKVLRRTNFNPWMATLYDMIGVPVTRMLEEFIRPPVGKNILLIGRRPADGESGIAA